MQQTNSCVNACLTSSDEQGGEFNGLNRLEAIERVKAEQDYVTKVIEKHHGVSADNPTRPIQKIEGNIAVMLADTSTHTLPAQPLIENCETAKRMVTYRNGVCGDNSTNVTTSDKDGGRSVMEISLVEFDSRAVVSFMNVLVLLHDDQSSDDDEAKSKYVLGLINEGTISEQHIVECVRLAHYLQCLVILDALASVLQQCIDSQNCMAICSLADTLNLKSLFEASIEYVLERLDALQGTEGVDNNENKDTNGDIWATLPHELKSRVLTMRNVMRSSVIGRGSKVSGLFFSSGDEFLAIFMETIRDGRERLAEAHQRHDEVISQRTEEWVIRCERRGRWFDRSDEAKRDFIHGPDVKYAMGKIEKQTHRLQTLETFYEEQKIIFSGGELGFGSEIRL